MVDAAFISVHDNFVTVQRKTLEEQAQTFLEECPESAPYAEGVIAFFMTQEISEVWGPENPLPNYIVNMINMTAYAIGQKVQELRKSNGSV